MKIFLIFLLTLISLQVQGINEINEKKYLCKELLWGFEFISSNKVNVITTDINDKTNLKKYYYEKNYDLSYINLYLYEDKIKNIKYSIHSPTFRVDVWTMTSGGNTSREIIPEDFCKEIKIDNLKSHIESLIKINK